MSTPKVGDTILFGTHGATPGRDVLPMPALVCAVRPEVENGLPLLDIYIWNSNMGSCGFAWKVQGFEKLRVGGWSLSAEVDQSVLDESLKPETRPPGLRHEPELAPPEPAAEAPDPQIEGIPNIFGGRTYYHAATNMQGHTNDQGKRLFVCPTCHKDTWFVPTDKIPEGSCCSAQIKRGHRGEQADPKWDRWKIPDDTVLVGKGDESEELE